MIGVEDAGDALRALRDLVLPRACAVCGEPVEAFVAGRICGGCLEEFEELCYDGVPLCGGCARPAKKTPCRECRRGGAVRFDAAASFGPFEGKLRDAVHALKFEGDASLGFALGRLVARAAARLPRAHVVVPVPLHFGRLLERGFNQSALLAREVARALDKPLVLDALSRRVGSVEQSGSTRKRRLANVHRAFAAQPAGIDGKHVLLVDDVLTSGATAAACVGALKEQGADLVFVVTLARAEGSAA